MEASAALLPRPNGERIFELRLGIYGGAMAGVSGKTIRVRGEFGREAIVPFAGIGLSGDPDLPLLPVQTLNGRTLPGDVPRCCWFYAPPPRRMGERLAIAVPSFG